MTPRKERLAERDRERRETDETYGRGGGDRFAEEAHPHAYGTPGGTDWRRAMRAYVRGHDRGWSADRKYSEAAEEPARTSRPEQGEEDSRPERATHRGVAIPDRAGFSFHRAASIWRDRLPASERLPRHTDRELDGQRGEGDQA